MQQGTTNPFWSHCVVSSRRGEPSHLYAKSGEVGKGGWISDNTTGRNPDLFLVIRSGNLENLDVSDSAAQNTTTPRMESDEEEGPKRKTS